MLKILEHLQSISVTTGTILNSYFTNDYETSEIKWKEWVPEICMTNLDSARPKAYTRSKSKSISVKLLMILRSCPIEVKGEEETVPKRLIWHFNHLVKSRDRNFWLQHCTLIFDLQCARSAPPTTMMRII